MKLRALRLISKNPTFTQTRLNSITAIIIPTLIFYLAWSRGGGDLTNQAVTSTILGALLILYSKNKPLSIPVCPGFLSLLALAILSFVSAIYAPTPDNSLIFGFGLTNLIFNLILIHNFILRGGNKISFLRTLIIEALIILGYGFKYYAIGKKMEISHNMIKFFIGRFFWKNPMATYLGLLLPISFFLYLEDTKRFAKIAYAIFLVFGGVGFILTGSRAAWICFLGSTIISTFLFKRYISKKLVLTAAGFAAIILIVLPIFSPPRFLLKRAKDVTQLLKKGETIETSFEERKDLLQAGIRIFKDHFLFGAGANSFAGIYPQYMKRIRFASQYAHNQYIQFAAELGLIGLTLIITFLVSSLMLILKNPDKIFSLFIFTGALFFVFRLAFDIDWYITVLPIIFTTYIGMTLPSQNKKIPLPITIGVITVVILYFTTRAIGESYYNFARTDFIKGRKEKALKELKIASILSPLKSEIYQGLGDLYNDMGESSRSFELYRLAARLDKVSAPANLRLARLFVNNQEPDSAIYYYKKAISYSRSLNPNYYNEFGRYLLALGKMSEAKSLFDTVANVFRWGINWGYNEKTVAHRYYVADALVELARLEQDTLKAKGYIARAESLGAPRETDHIARTFGEEIDPPEKVVKDFYSAWSNGEIELASSYLTDKSYKLVPMKGRKIEVVRILDVFYSYWEGVSDVVYLTRCSENQRETYQRGRFRLYKMPTGWKIEPAE